MSKPILVLGATGMLGKPVARHLQEAGFQVRVLVRDKARAETLFSELFEVVQGDATDASDLAEAMRGCEGVHVSVGGAADQASAENVAELAPRLGVEQISYISGSTVCEENGWFPMTAQKLQAEAAIRQANVPYTIFCPTWPMEQLPRFIIGGRATLVGDKPLAWHWFAADDLGRMVANAYQRAEARDKRLYVHGPQRLTMAEALEQYCRAFHPQIEMVNKMPIAMARAAAAASGNQMLRFFADLMDYFEQAGEPGDPAEANALLGEPQTTLARWIRQQETAVAV